MVKNKGKIIRDVIHGDIFVPNKFLKIIDTAEFQRLHRINQLSIAYMLFPGANHTRYSHSLGTYYVMNLLISHFEEQLNDIGIELKEEEKDIALASALLHDIGHGPFSHAFESALKDTKNEKSHEKWTVDIIRDSKTEINRVLIETFNDKFPDKVASLIEDNKNQENSSFDLFYILKSLISSQIDADRMDYLLRDSFYTGVVAGQIDISRLINALTITMYEDGYYVCIKNKFLPSIEEYLLSRYHMNNGVYYHDFKCQMEDIIKKIINRSRDLYKNGILEDCEVHNSFKVILEDKRKLTTEEYLKLDDSTFTYMFNNWKYNNDRILSELCKTFSDRKKFTKLNLFNNSEEDIVNFKEMLVDEFSKIGYDVNLDEKYYWVESSNLIDIYKYSDENIWVLDKDGVVKELTDVSLIIKKDEEKEKKTTLKTAKNISFINLDLLEEDLKYNRISFENIKVCRKKVEDLIEMFDSRNNIEIERKYNVLDKDTFFKIKENIQKIYEKDTEIFIEEKYKFIGEKVHIEQEDIYFLDENDDINGKGCTLRIRTKNNEKVLTLKIPVDVKHEDIKINQSERFEEKIKINFNNFDNIDDDEIETDILPFIPVYMSNEIPMLKEKDFWKGLKEEIRIKNNRTKYMVIEKINNEDESRFELVLDELRYIKEEKVEKKDFQIEVELCSDDYRHRINLKQFTDRFEEHLEEMGEEDIKHNLEPTHDSKFERAQLAFSNSKEV